MGLIKMMLTSMTNFFQKSHKYAEDEITNCGDLNLIFDNKMDETGC